MNEQREVARDRKTGRYKNMPECPRCGKRRALEPIYFGEGTVPAGSPWEGLFICNPCIKQENKKK